LTLPERQTCATWAAAIDMDNELHALLRELEARLMHTAEPDSAAVFDELLADDFVEFGRSGRVYDKHRVLEELPHQPPARIAIADFHVRQLADDLALVTYRTHVEGAPASEARHAVRSSIWRRAGSAWQMIFHQGTPVAFHVQV